MCVFLRGRRGACGRKGSLTESACARADCAPRAWEELAFGFLPCVVDLTIERMATVDRLCVLDLSCCFSVTDNALVHLGANAPRLAVLSLHMNRNVTWRGIAAIARGCPHLSSLDLSSCPSIDSRALQALGEYSRRLRTLRLTRCAITDGGIAQLAKGCANLHTLGLINCEHLTESTLDALSGHPGLAVLDLYHAKIPAAAIRRFERLNPRINVLTST